jgi:hypothetical protein
MNNIIGIIDSIRAKITLQNGIDEFSLTKKGPDKIIRLKKIIKFSTVNMIIDNFFIKIK